MAIVLALLSKLSFKQTEKLRRQYERTQKDCSHLSKKQPKTQGHKLEQL